MRTLISTVYILLGVCIVAIAFKSSSKHRIRASNLPRKLERSVLRLLENDNDLLVYKDIETPKFGVKSLDEIKVATSKSSDKNINKADVKSKVKSASTFGSMTIEDLKKRMIPLENAEGKPLPQRTEDLNGINPFVPLLFSSIPFAMAFGGYTLSSYLTANFAVQFLSSDVYTLQRIAIVARNILVGMTTLATTFCGVIGLGLFLLGLTVGLGVLKGELDPNKNDINVNKTSP